MGVKYCFCRQIGKNVNGHEPKAVTQNQIIPEKKIAPLVVFVNT